MASQFSIYMLHIVPLFTIWLAIVFGWIPLLQYGPSCECFQHVVFYAPIYAVLLLGVYAVSSVVYGVLTFNDCADAKSELVREIKEAREDLLKKKII